MGGLLFWATPGWVAGQASADGGGVLLGKVVDADGHALEGARVTAELEPAGKPGKPAAAAGQGGAGDVPSQQASSATTDRHGAFAFLQLEPGTYRLWITAVSGATRSAGTVAVNPTEPAYAAFRAGRDEEPARLRGVVDRAGLGAFGAAEGGAEIVFDSAATQTVAATSSAGDRADTPQEDEEHGSAAVDSPDVVGMSARLEAGIEGLAGDGRLLPGQVRSPTNGISSVWQATRGQRDVGAAGGLRFAGGAVPSLRGGHGTYSAQAGGVGVVESLAGRRMRANGVHGGGFATVRVSAFDATNPYSLVTRYQDGVIFNRVVKPDDTDVQAGAHVGLAPLGRSAGPWRERVFALASLEGRVRSAPVESSPATAGFYALTPTQRALLGTRGVTGAQVNTALNYLDGLTGEIARRETRLLSFGRLDVRGGPAGGGGKADGPTRDSVAVTFAGHHLSAPAGAEFDQLADAVVARGRGSVGDRATDMQVLAGQWTHAFRSSLENAVRVQWAHDLESELPRAPLPQEPAISPGGAAPEVQIAPEGFAFGTPANLDRTAYPEEQRMGVADTLRWVPGFLGGRHLLSVGGSWSRVADRVDSLRNANGTFVYDSDDRNGRAGGLVDWITDATFNVHAYPNGGCPSITAAVHDFCFRTYTQSFGNAQQRFTTHEFAGFAEDSFQAGAGLRVTLGVRYEYVLLPLPQVPNTGLDASLRALALPNELAGATGAYPEDRNNVAPRAGIAWSPRGGRWFTVHAGYGWFYGRLPGTTLRAALADNGLPTGIEQVRITPTTETACPQVANQGFGYPCAFGGPPPGAVAQTGTVMLFADRFRLPAIQRASVTVERALGQRFALQLGYAGAVATQLPTSVDVNIAPAAGVAQYLLQGGAGVSELASGRAFRVPVYTARRLPSYGPITAITSQANASYHAGTLAVRVRAWHGVEARGSITFSRAIDDNPQSGGAAGPRVNGSFDPFAIGYDKGLSDLQAPLRFAGFVSGRLEARRGPRALRAGLSGWRAVAAATASSGPPYSYEVFGGTRLSGGHTSINGSGGSTYLPTVGRNTLRLPARANVDLRLERGVTFGTQAGGAMRGVRLSTFAEAFNLLNQRNLSRVETRAFLVGLPVNGVTPLVFQDAATVASEGVTTPPFATPTSSTSGVSRERLLAVGMRVEF